MAAPKAVKAVAAPKQQPDQSPVPYHIKYPPKPGNSCPSPGGKGTVELGEISGFKPCCIKGKAGTVEHLCPVDTHITTYESGQSKDDCPNCPSRSDNNYCEGKCVVRIGVDMANDAILCCTPKNYGNAVELENAGTKKAAPKAVKAVVAPKQQPAAPKAVKAVAAPKQQPAGPNETKDTGRLQEGDPCKQYVGKHCDEKKGLDCDCPGQRPSGTPCKCAKPSREQQNIGGY